MSTGIPFLDLRGCCSVKHVNICPCPRRHYFYILANISFYFALYCAARTSRWPITLNYNENQNQVCF